MEDSERLEKLLQVDQKKFLSDLKQLIDDGDSELSYAQSLHMLDIIKTQGRSDVLEVMIDGESLLHTAAKFHRNFTVMDALITQCPKLVTLKRSEEYEGQTVLHILIARGDTENVKRLFAHPKVEQDTKKHLLKMLATGKRFQKTILMGETPLSVAALAFEKDMVNLLLSHGASITDRNSKGETVLHSLVRYANRDCRKLTDDASLTQTRVIDMLRLLHETLLDCRCGDKDCSDDGPSCARKVWLVENNDGMTALYLSALLGEALVLSHILDLPWVYRHFSNHDDIFDIEKIDITEIDTAARLRYLRSKSQDKSDDCNLLCCLRGKTCKKPPAAILEVICETNVNTACKIVTTPVIKKLIKEKWINCRIFFFLWCFLELSSLAIITSYAVFKAKVIATLNAGAEQGNDTIEAATTVEEDFVTSVCWLSLAVGIGLLAIEAFRTFWLWKPWKLKLVHHNGSYRLIMVLMSVCLILDSMWYLSSPSTNRKGLLAFAVLFAWWFTTFFLRPFKRFSFFTVMLQKIILGDVLRFSTLFLIELISFTTTMHMTFLHSQPVPEEFHSYGRSMLTMFRLMLGLSDLEILTQAEEAWLSVLLFVVFVILTYVLLMNSLIALMSNTCSDISNRTELFYLQRLSVILFMEDMMVDKLVPSVGQEDGVYALEGEEKNARSFMELRSDGKISAWRERYIRPARKCGVNGLSLNHLDKIDRDGQIGDAGRIGDNQTELQDINISKV